MLVYYQSKTSPFPSLLKLKTRYVMVSVVLSSLYYSIGNITRPLRWYRQVGHVRYTTLNKNTAQYYNSEKLDGFSPLSQLFNYATKTPNRTLIADQYGDHSVIEVFTNALRLGKALQDECKVKPGDRVALMTMAEREMFESFFAIQAIGAVPVPINFVNKPMTIAFMFSDSEAKTLIVGKDPRLIRGAQRLGNFGFLQSVISIENNTDSRFYNYKDLIAAHHPLLDDLRYITNPPPNAPGIILYTSGTGSAPRGVVYPYENISYATEKTIPRFPFSSDDVMLFPVPFYHLAGLISFIGAMYPREPENSFCKLVLTDIPRYKEPETINRTYESMIKNKVTIFPGSPMIIESVLEKASEKQGLLPNLHLIISGGSPMTKKLMRQVKELNDKRRIAGLREIELQNFYACTEFGPIATGKIDLSDTDDASKRRWLGTTLPDIEVKNTERTLTYFDGKTYSVLAAKSPFTLSGYLNRPELPFLTKDKFVIIGDCVEIVKNNDTTELIYNGRDRGSLNIKGNEISPENTQEELEKLDGIDNVCVFGVDDEETGGHILCAFIVLKPGSNLNAETIDNFLKKAELPSRNRPSVYFFEKIIPQEIINGSSKITPRLVSEVYKSEVNRLIKVNHSQYANSKPIERFNAFAKLLQL